MIGIPCYLTHCRGKTILYTKPTAKNARYAAGPSPSRKKPTNKGRHGNHGTHNFYNRTYSRHTLDDRPSRTLSRPDAPHSPGVGQINHRSTLQGKEGSIHSY